MNTIAQPQVDSQAQRINQLSREEGNELHELYRSAQQYNPNGWHVSWNEERQIYVEEARISFLRAIANGLLRPAIQAMMSASGLNINEAKTGVYYAVLTYLLDDYPELVPILLFQGNSGTGKSAAENQLEKLVNQPKRIEGRTYSQVGRSINGAVTAIVDEGDFKQDRVELELLQLRCCARYANQTIHIPPEQRPININNFGATIIARRKPFSDTATRNRTITIKTQRRPGNYQQVDIDNQGIRAMAGIIRRYTSAVDTSDRVNDAWKPITEIATTIGDAEWLGYQLGELRRAQQMLSAGDQYEPEDVLIKAIMACCNGDFNRAIKLKDIKNRLESNFDVKWTTQSVHTMVVSLGFEIGFYQGYDHLRANPELLTTLANERGIAWEEGIE
ncbi:hypothetical protein ACFLWS_02780 [Chloroflexota bacterium]